MNKKALMMATVTTVSLFLTFSFDTSVAKNPAYPQGSYILTCNDIQIDVGCKSKANPAPVYTFHAEDFIHEKLTAEDAKYLNQQLSLKNAKAGDIAILVGMHVTTREIKRWTWQTFWWSANPDAPYAPSSSSIANQCPL